ncbi:MAG: right-handed parallel beta-helix repeat-containing protein [Planctomycetota bacterium]
MLNLGDRAYESTAVGGIKWASVKGGIVPCRPVHAQSSPGDDAAHHVVYIKNASHVRLRNCLIRGNGTVDRNGSEWSLTGVLVKATPGRETHDILIENCEITGAVSGFSNSSGCMEGLVLRGNHVHFMAGSHVKLSGSVRERILVENNLIADKFQPPGSAFHGSGISCRARPVTIRGNIIRNCGGTSNMTFYWQTFHGGVVVSGDLADPQTEFEEDEPVMQPDTGASGVADRISSGCVTTLLRNQEVNAFVSGGDIIGQASGAVLTNVIVTSVRPYGGYRDMVVENNLNYDSRNISNMRLSDLGDHCVFRNNTVVGRWHNLDPSKPRYRYFGVGSIGFAHGTDPSTFRMHNNILVGELSIGETDDLVEDYNIIWALRGEGGQTANAMTGAHTKLCVINYGTLTVPIDYFETSSGFFVGGSEFDAYSFQYPEDATHEFGYTHGRDLGACYALAADSDAVGFADAAHAPATDLRGIARDATPDAGCYERVDDVPGDADADGDVDLDDFVILKSNFGR